MPAYIQRNAAGLQAQPAIDRRTRAAGLADPCPRESLHLPVDRSRILEPGGKARRGGGKENKHGGIADHRCSSFILHLHPKQGPGQFRPTPGHIAVKP